MGKKRKGVPGGVRRSQAEADEIDDLETRIQEFQNTAEDQDGSGPGGSGIIWNFDNLPISQYTLEGLKSAKYTRLTAIQRAALPHTLAGKDVLGAAKTGSGKTLAFLIPVVEKLFRLKWGNLDGLGALVISPTRELAMQIFDELRKVGAKHDLSAGLLIGGKNVKEEQGRVNAMNILVCTPGRLLQHMDETPGFDASSLQLLVLDEADRILDMGFSASVNAIIENLPQQRQTMLFSATQTKSVKDLARLSLRDPTYISVHAEALAPTPIKLQQAYVVCDLQDKLNVLWAFIKAHLKAKILVFLTTGKQVKFALEVFRRLRPGVVLRALHGKMKQMKRMAVYYDFCQAKTGTVLFATDIAARGLDFPTVDWVLQVDCPEDVASYIHRVGRTARYVSGGKSLLMLLPSEKEAMLKQLEDAKVPLKPLKINPSKTQPVSPALQALLSKNNDLKELAQRALVAYVRSIFLQPNKAVFDASALPAADFALSMGLTSVPKLRFLKRHGPKKAGKGGEEDARLTEGLLPKQEAGCTSAAQVPGAQTASGRRDEEGLLPKQHAESISAAQSAGEAEGDESVSEESSAPENSSDEEERQADPSTVYAKPHESRGVKRSSMEAQEDDSRGEDMRQATEEAGVSSRGAAAPGSTEAAGDAEEDAFLVVKRRDVFDAAPTPSAAAPVEAGEPEKQGRKKLKISRGSCMGMPREAKRQKRKKLRISKGSASGNRLVFNEEGLAQDPLAQLSLPDNSRDGEEEALTAEERFRRAREAMRARDATDRAAQKAARRSKKLDRKERLRAQAAGESDDDAGVQLGATSLGASMSEGEDMTDDEGTADELSDSEGVEDRLAKNTQKPAPSAARPEVAHLGMQPRKALSGKAEFGKGQKKKKGPEQETMSIAEQECLALDMLSRR